MIQSNSDTGLTLSGFLIIVTLGTFLWKGAPLDSVRPVSNNADTSVNGAPGMIHARMWQDPLMLAEQSFNNDSQEITEPGQECTANSNQLIFKSIRCKLKALATDNRVNIILATLSHGNYAELMESRRRFRYAILSALGEEGFAPKDASRMELVYRKRVNIANHCETVDRRTCAAIPYEWYEKEDEFENNNHSDNSNQKALVIWLDESLIHETPLKLSYEFVNSILDSSEEYYHPVNVFMLGPNRSGTLRQLIKEDSEESVKKLQEHKNIAAFNIVSATATVDDKWFPKNIWEADSSRFNAFKELFSGDDCHDKNSFLRADSKAGKTCLRFLRTINSDSKHIDLLVKELTRNRHIKQDDKIVLISEWDTFFGRSLPEEFKSEFVKEVNKQDPEQCPNDADHDNFIEYTYIRGIDGVLDERVTEKKKTDKKKGRETSSRIDERDLRRPTGSSQYDYLRRLTAEIKNKDDKMRLSGGNGVRAVVLLGNDVYDKLLIMRALRAELPGAIFATTDLNAQLLHPAEFNWARNTIVTSTYGLAPRINKIVKHSDNQKKIEPISVSTPPFRDSYQTSLYTATRLLFNKDMQKEGLDDIPEKIPAQLFEIGRQQAVALPYDFNNDSNVEQQEQEQLQVYWNRADDHGKPYLLFVSPIILGIILIFAYHQLFPRSAYQVITMSTFLVGFVILGSFIISRDNNTDPFDIMSGASVWPAIYIRLLCVMLSIVFIIITLNSLQNSWIKLDKKYFIRKKARKKSSDKGQSSEYNYNNTNISLREFKNQWQKKLAALYNRKWISRKYNEETLIL